MFDLLSASVAWRGCNGHPMGPQTLDYGTEKIPTFSHKTKMFNLYSQLVAAHGSAAQPGRLSILKENSKKMLR